VATPLNVNVVELLRWPGTTKDVLATVEVEDFEFNDERVSNVPISINVHLESLSNGVSVAGAATATWHGECRRCLTPLSQLMIVDLSELYQQIPEDPDAYAIVNDQINLLPMVRENVLVAIPLGPLCREDCPGFCPQCGADLSEGACGCDSAIVDPRWSALENLKGTLPD
jgi:uncharacterized protein